VDKVRADGMMAFHPFAPMPVWNGTSYWSAPQTPGASAESVSSSTNANAQLCTHTQAHTLMHNYALTRRMHAHAHMYIVAFFSTKPVKNVKN
jgi:hypothetical protein